MQLLYQKTLTYSRQIEVGFKQNFLKFDKNLYKNQKIRSYFQLKLLKCSSSNKKTLHNPEKSKLVSTKFFKIWQKSVQKSKNSKIISTRITQMQLLYQKNLTYSRQIEVGFNTIFYNLTKICTNIQKFEVNFN